MNGLINEAIARVRTQTRHTKLKNQYEIYKKKRKKPNIITKRHRTISFLF
jgi:hypothetical protein